MVFRRLTAAVFVLASLACSKDRGTDPSEDSVYQIAIQGGDDQQGAAGSVLALPLQIKVTDPAGDPVRSVAVVFRPAAQSGVTLSDTVVGTGIDGIARVDARLGSQQGEYTIAAAFVRGQDENMETFKARGTPGPTLTGSSKQSTQAGDTITLTGTSFNSSAAGNTVFFGSARARIINATASSITIVVPPCVSPGAVPLVVEVGTARTSSINVTYVQTSPTLTLALYEGITISGTELGNCLRLPGDGASYLVVPQFASASVPLATHSFQLGNSSAPVPQSLSASLDRSVREGATSLQSRFDLALRAAERRMPVPTAAEIAANRPISLEALTLNSTRDFRVLCSLDPEETCFKTATAKLKHIGQNVLVYIDEKSPSNGLTDAELTNFGKLFDETLYPIDLRTFGPESDIDGNGKVIMLLTPIVNALSPKPACTTQGQVLGFFFGFDLSSRSKDSNKGEIFYGFVPDPAGQVSCAISKAAVQSLLPSTFIHELQHMISYNQHALVRGGSQETDWLNEGLSHLAEELASRHYENKFPPPSGRSSPGNLFPDSAFGFIAEQLENSYSYLLDPESTSLTLFETNECCEGRGAAWLFVRYLGDLRDSTIFTRLVQTSRTSVENVENVMGEAFTSVFADFGMALYTDSIPGVPRNAVSPRLRFKSRNLRYLYDALFRAANRTSPNSNFPRAFPILVKNLPYNQSINGAMVPSTFAYYQLDTPPGSAPAGLRFATPAGGVFNPDLKAQVGIFRLR